MIRASLLRRVVSDRVPHGSATKTLTRTTTSWREAAPWTIWRGSFGWQHGVGRFSLQPDSGPASETVPDLRSALQDQLGLKLQSVRLAVDTLIIDHLERLTED